MRLAPWLLGLFLLLPGVTQAASFDDPKALVAALYDPYAHGEKQADLPSFYSERLKTLFAQHASAANVDHVSAKPALPDAMPPDFDPFVNAKHYLMLNLLVSDPVINGDRALVNVSYTNFDRPTVLSLSLVKGPDGWKVDDVASMGADQHWMLSWLLAYDPWGQS